MTDFARLTPCGECCTGCRKRKEGLCSGCRESGGRCEEWAASGICPVYDCCERHDALFCGLCSEFPCGHLPMQRWRPDCVKELQALAEEYCRQHSQKGSSP